MIKRGQPLVQYGFTPACLIPGIRFLEISLGKADLFRMSKTGCPGPPRPVKLTKPTGRSGVKLTADSIHTPFHYVHKLCLRGRKSRKIFSFDFHLTLCTDCDYLLHRNALPIPDVNPLSF